jgi:hypothetical protein
MDWRRGSRGGVPAQQVQSPEFKTQSHQKKKKALAFFCISVNVLEATWVRNEQGHEELNKYRQNSKPS